MEEQSDYFTVHPFFTHIALLIVKKLSKFPTVVIVGTSLKL